MSYSLIMIQDFISATSRFSWKDCIFSPRFSWYT